VKTGVDKFSTKTKFQMVPGWWESRTPWEMGRTVGASRTTWWTTLSLVAQILNLSALTPHAMRSGFTVCAFIIQPTLALPRAAPICGPWSCALTNDATFHHIKHFTLLDTNSHNWIIWIYFLLILFWQSGGDEDNKK